MTAEPLVVHTVEGTVLTIDILTDAGHHAYTLGYAKPPTEELIERAINYYIERIHNGLDATPGEKRRLYRKAIPGTTKHLYLQFNTGPPIIRLPFIRLEDTTFVIGWRYALFAISIHR